MRRASHDLSTKISVNIMLPYDFIDLEMSARCWAQNYLFLYEHPH
jgi:hypothetical protein